MLADAVPNSVGLSLQPELQNYGVSADAAIPAPGTSGVLGGEAGPSGADGAPMAEPDGSGEGSDEDNARSGTDTMHVSKLTAGQRRRWVAARNARIKKIVRAIPICESMSSATRYFPNVWCPVLSAPFLYLICFFCTEVKHDGSESV